MRAQICIVAIGFLLILNLAPIESEAQSADSFNEHLEPHEYYSKGWDLAQSEVLNYSVMVQESFGKYCIVFVCDSDGHNDWANDVGTIPVNAYQVVEIPSLYAYSEEFTAPTADTWYFVVYNNMSLASTNIIGGSYVVGRAPPTPPPGLLDLLGINMFEFTLYSSGMLISIFTVITCLYYGKSTRVREPVIPSPSEYDW